MLPGQLVSVQRMPGVIKDPGALPGGVGQTGGEAAVFAHIVHHDGGEDWQMVFGAVHANALQQGAQFVLTLLQSGQFGQFGVTNGGAFLCRLDEDIPQLIIAGRDTCGGLVCHNSLRREMVALVDAHLGRFGGGLC